MKIELDREKIVKLWNVLTTFNGTYDKTFSMYLILNQKKLKPFVEEIMEIQKTLEPTEEYKELQKQEFAIISKYSEKDSEGQPIKITENSFKIKEGSVEQYKEEYNIFKEKNIDILKKSLEVRNEVQELMQENIEIDIIKMPFKSLPSEIDISVLDNLSELIKDLDKIEEELVHN